MSNSSRGDIAVAKDFQQLVVRPTRRLQRNSGGTIGIAAWILTSFFYSLQFHGWTRVVVVGASVAVAVGVIGLISLSYQRTKLTMIGRRLIFTRPLHDRIVLVGDSTARVVDVEVVWRNASGRRSRLWLLIDSAGRTAVGLTRKTWDDRQLEGIRESLGLPIEIVETPQRPAELRKAYPGTIPWWAAHSSIATALAIVILTALVLMLQHLGS